MSLPLVLAADFRVSEIRESPRDRLRGEVTKAVNEARAQTNEWQKLQCEARSWNPGDFLSALILKVLPPTRLSEIEVFLQTNDVHMGVLQAVQQDQVSHLLDCLNVEELLEIERLAISKTGGMHEFPAATKEALYDSIKANVGLLPNSAAFAKSASEDAASLLLRKIEADEFDVFLAHNSADRQKVLKLGQMLRSEGVYPWIDVEQIPPGRWFQDVIQSAVRKVKAAAVVIGASGIGRWQAFELRTCLSKCVEASFPVIPVLLPGVDALPEELVFLRELNYNLPAKVYDLPAICFALKS